MTARVPEPIERLSARALFDALIDSAPEGFALFDRELRFVHVNPALARINGVPPAEQIGRRVDEVVPGVPEEGAAAPLRKVFETGEPVVDLEVNGVVPADPDDPRTWLVSFYPVRDRAGGVGWVGTLVVDITDRKRAEERAALLADLGQIMDEAEGVKERLSRLTRALVPRVADLAIVTLREDDGRLRRAALAHADAAVEARIAGMAVTDDSELGFLPRSPGGSMLLHQVDERVERAFGPEHPARFGTQAAIISPLRAPAGEIGWLALAWERPHRLAEHEIALNEDMARRLAINLERARLYESERAAREQTQRLQAATAALSNALTAQEVVDAILREGMPAAGASMAAIWRIDKAHQALELVGHRGYGGGTRTPMARIELDAALPVPECVRTQKPLWLGGEREKSSRYPALATRGVGVAADALYVLPLTTGTGPIGAVALCFPSGTAVPDDTLAFAAALAAQCAQALERARLFEAEREVAGILQRSLLPARLPKVTGAEFAVRYLPAAGLEAGGDFYEAIRLAGGAIGLAVGDVVGRGAAAAAVMGQLRSALRAFALDGAGPGEVLARLSRFAETVDDALAATAAYAVLEPSGAVRYACAGHPYPVLAHPGGRTEVLREGRGVPLGVAPGSEYPEARAQLEPGSTLLMYTDGLVERRGHDMTQAMEALSDALGSLADEPLARILDEVIGRHVDDAPGDDVALIAVRLTGRRAVRRLEAPAAPQSVGEIRHAMRDWLHDRGLPPATTTDVLLASGEAVANAVEHAFAGQPAGRVCVELQWMGDVVEVVVADDGVWRDAPSEPDRGRGFTLMRALMDHVDVERSDAGTTVRLRLAGAAPRADADARAPAAAGADGPFAQVQHGENGGVVVAEVTGELDLATAGAVADQLTALAERADLTVDLSRVSFIDSSGIQALLSAARRRPGTVTVVAPPGSPARRALDLAGAAQILPLLDGR